MSQYTIRNVPGSLDNALREWARRRGVSLNQAALDALRRGVGMDEEAREYHDLDDLIGTWKQDEEFDRAVEEQDRIDRELWR